MPDYTADFSDLFEELFGFGRRGGGPARLRATLVAGVEMEVE